MDSKEAGQINAFFRWNNLKDTAEILEMSLFLISASNLDTKFTIPTAATTDVTMRRLQHFKLKPGAGFKWEFGSAKGEGKVDELGLITIPSLKITATPATFSIRGNF